MTTSADEGVSHWSPSAEGGAEDPAKAIGHHRGGRADGELAQPPTHQRAAGEHAGGWPGGEQRDPDQDRGGRDRGGSRR